MIKHMHRLDLNLDDPQECRQFIEKHATLRGRVLARRLGLTGRGSARLASHLSNFVWNKSTAMDLRAAGKIEDALRYEEICDRIYKENIKPNLKAW